MQKTKPLSLRRNFSWTFIGNLVYAASQWGMLVILAKLGSPEIVGQFTLGLAVTAPIFMLTNLQLRAVQATDAKKHYLFNDYLGLRLIGVAVALLIITAIALMSKNEWETSFVIMLVGLAKAFESISDVFYGLLQQHERMDKIAVSLMIKGLLSLLLLGIGIWISGSIVWGTLGLAVAWALLLGCYDIRNGVVLLEHHSQIQPRWDKKTLSKLAWLSLPLGLVMMLISLNTNIPRYFIEIYLGKGELGIFAAIAYLMVAGTMVVNSLGESASPRLAKHFAAGENLEFRNLLLKLSGIGALLGALGITVALVGGRWILTILYQPEYGEHVNVFIWLMVASGIGYIGSFLGFGITATRAFNQFLLPYLLASAVTAISSLVLIPKYGLVGAAWGLCASSLTTCLMPLLILTFIFRKKTHESTP